MTYRYGAGRLIRSDMKKQRGSAYTLHAAGDPNRRVDGVVFNSRLVDKFGRAITYLRISVTDRCNLNCHYCHGSGPIKKIPRSSILSFEEIAEFARSAAELGVTKVRLTGGEPLLRRNISRLITLLAEIPGLSDICMTTNGTLLSSFARELKNAGLTRINVSVDTLDASKYRIITRGGDLNVVMDGIRQAQEVGFNPVKLNFVLMPKVNDEELDRFTNYCRENGYVPQIIAWMDLNGSQAVLNRGANTSRPPACEECDKLRLTCDGRLYPCLFSERFLKIREAESYRSALMEIAAVKEGTGRSFPHAAMADIGG